MVGMSKCGSGEVEKVQDRSSKDVQSQDSHGTEGR